MFQLKVKRNCETIFKRMLKSQVKSKVRRWKTRGLNYNYTDIITSSVSYWSRKHSQLSSSCQRHACHPIRSTSVAPIWSLIHFLAVLPFSSIGKSLVGAIRGWRWVSTGRLVPWQSSRILTTAVKGTGSQAMTAPHVSEHSHWICAVWRKVRSCE